MLILDFYINYFEILQNSKTENNIFYSSSNLYEYSENFFNESKIIGKYYVKIIIYKDNKVGKSTFIFDDKHIGNIVLPSFFSGNFFEKICYSNNFVYYTNQSIQYKKYYIEFKKKFLKGRYTITVDD